jgi:hypothetical protein
MPSTKSQINSNQHAPNVWDLKFGDRLGIVFWDLEFRIVDQPNVDRKGIW